MRTSSTLARAAVLLVFSASLVPGGAGASDDKKKIYVAPFAPLYQQVPLRLGVQTSELVRRELAEQKSVIPVEGPTVTQAEDDEAEEVTSQARSQALRRAGNLLEQAREQAGAQRFDRAVRLYRSALDQYEDNLFFVQDFSSFVDVHLELALSLFRAGREEEADGYLSDVLRLDFERSAGDDEYPAAFVERFETVRDRLARSSRGGLSVMSSPPGAEVILNGKKLGRTPLRMQSLVPGRHYLRVEAPGVAPDVRSIDVTSGEPEVVELTFGGTIEGPVADLVSGLASNRVGAAAMRQAGAVGRDLGADFVLFGVLQRGPRTYQVRTYLFEVGSGEVARLSDLRIDLDYLGAAIEIFRLAEEIASSVGDMPPALPVPFTVFDGASQVAITYTDVEAGPPAPRPEPEPRRREREREVARAEPERERSTGPLAPEPARPEPVEPTRPEPVEPTRPAPVEPERPEPVEPERPEPRDEPRRPVGPLAPADEPAQPGETREGPVGAGAMVAEPEPPDAGSERRPFAPVVPSAADTPPDQEPPEELEPSEPREMVQVGGARGRLLDPDLEPSKQRFAAVDIDEVVIIEEDEDKKRDGWPWWAWGLAAVGLAGVGAGAWYVAPELGGGHSNATVTIEW